MSLELSTRYVRGWVPAEERQRAWIAQPTDPHHEFPKEGKQMVVKALLCDGAILPGYPPGYTQVAVSDETVLEESDTPHWQPVDLTGTQVGEGVGQIFTYDNKLISAVMDYSGSVVTASLVSCCQGCGELNYSAGMTDSLCDVCYRASGPLDHYALMGLRHLLSEALGYEYEMWGKAEVEIGIPSGELSRKVLGHEHVTIQDINEILGWHGRRVYKLASKDQIARIADLVKQLGVERRFAGLISGAYSLDSREATRIEEELLAAASQAQEATP
jgi:hypothetical protein